MVENEPIPSKEGAESPNDTPTSRWKSTSAITVSDTGFQYTRKTKKEFIRQNYEYGWNSTLHRMIPRKVHEEKIERQPEHATLSLTEKLNKYQNGATPQKQFNELKPTRLVIQNTKDKGKVSDNQENTFVRCCHQK